VSSVSKLAPKTETRSWRRSVGFLRNRIRWRNYGVWEPALAVAGPTTCDPASSQRESVPRMLCRHQHRNVPLVISETDAQVNSRVGLTVIRVTIVLNEPTLVLISCRSMTSLPPDTLRFIQSVIIRKSRPALAASAATIVADSRCRTALRI